jgi:hypothetical protein
MPHEVANQSANKVAHESSDQIADEGRGFYRKEENA